MILLCLHTRILEHSVIYLRQSWQRLFSAVNPAEHFDEAALDSLVFLPMPLDPGMTRLEMTMYERAIEHLNS